MASGSNTWCKKLMAKDKKFKMAQRLGSSTRHAVNGIKIESDLPLGVTFARRPRTFGSSKAA